MTYIPPMTWRTDGITVVKPVIWRSYDGFLGSYWQARSERDARGYYVSPDPRILLFFDDPSSNKEMSISGWETEACRRPMGRSIFIPAGVPLWTTSKTAHDFSHLNLHLHPDRALKILAPTIGSSAAMTALKSPVTLDDPGPLEDLARLLIDDMAQPAGMPAFAERLVGAMVGHMTHSAAASDGEITADHLREIGACLDASPMHRMTVVEMASAIAFPRALFSSAFRRATGQAPLEWQMSRRIDKAKDMLRQDKACVAEIAAQLGFFDQAHFTKVFRSATGKTPAVWRQHDPALGGYRSRPAHY